MGNIILSMHVTLDEFAAGPNGEMDWIKIDDEMFDFVGNLTDNSDTALYGRKTFEMMDSYWPKAGENPQASKHDKEHSSWYNRVNKYVLSQSMNGKDRDKIKFINGNLSDKINSIKKGTSKSILIFGSPTAVHSLLEENLIDEFYLFVNPVLLGNGIPVFSKIKNKINLKLMATRIFKSCGVTALHYVKRS